MQTPKSKFYHLILYYSITYLLFIIFLCSPVHANDAACSALSDSNPIILGVTGPTKAVDNATATRTDVSGRTKAVEDANATQTEVARDPRIVAQEVLTAMNELHHTQFETNREIRHVIDEMNGTLAKVDVKKIERLDTRFALYATDATRTNKLNDQRPYEDPCDAEGRLSRVDIGECVHSCDDFLAELGRGGFGVVYLTKPTKEQPSVVLKVVSPLKRFSCAHEYLHLSKFKHCPYFVTVVNG